VDEFHLCVAADILNGLRQEGRLVRPFTHLFLDELEWLVDTLP
jgi:hypothetical protein